MSTGDVHACGICGEDYVERYGNRKYCSQRCGRRANPMPSLARQLSLSTATVGAMAELRVAIDLMRRGYHVFRALSPACPCDLYAFKDQGEHLRVEVRTAYRKPNGNGIYVNVAANGMGYTVLAAVLDDEIIYRPPLGGVGESPTAHGSREQGHRDTESSESTQGAIQGL